MDSGDTMMEIDEREIPADGDGDRPREWKRKWREDKRETQTDS